MRSRKIASMLCFIGLMFGTPALAATENQVIKALNDKPSYTTNLNDLSETDRREVTCLALNLYHEVRGSSVADILGVGFVTRNRIKAKNGPKTFCATIWERGQYSWTVKPTGALMPREMGSWNNMVQYARQIVTDDSLVDHTGGANTFYSKKLGIPRWTRKATSRKTIGAHIYVRIPGR